MKTVKVIMRVNNHVLRAAGGRAFKEKIAEYVNSINAENLNKTSELSPSKAHSKFERICCFHHKRIS